MYKPQTNLVNVCAQLISLRGDHFFGDTFDVLCFHMYKLQAYFENMSVLWKRLHRPQWERMGCPCVSQAVCHSATAASVVWPLALDIIFTRCVSPCPWNFNLDVVQTRSLLNWSHTGAFDFPCLCLYLHWYWGKGGNSIKSNSSFGKYYDSEPSKQCILMMSL